MRLIDGEATEVAMIDTIARMMVSKRWMRSDKDNEDEILAVIDNAPTIDAAPVVHGRNITTAGRKYRDFHCSVCGAGACNVEGGTLDGGYFNFCPNCGAKMDGGADDESNH